MENGNLENKYIYLRGSTINNTFFLIIIQLSKNNH